MAQQGIVLDDRRLRAKLNALGKEADAARRAAANDAAKQTRTHMSRLAARVLNLPARAIKDALPVKRASRKAGMIAEVSGRYLRTPAERFIGWRYIGAVRGRAVVGTARTSRLLDSLGNRKTGLFVKFFKGKPAAHFPRAFPLRGGFWQRETKDTPRLPIVRITGPSVHGVVEEEFPGIVAFGRGAYRRRLIYQIERRLERLSQR